MSALAQGSVAPTEVAPSSSASRRAADVAKRCLVSLCALTGLTNAAARWLGARYFLPELFVQRYANMAGVEPAVIAARLDGIRSFDERRWCPYWCEMGAARERAGDRALAQGDTAAAERELRLATTYFSIAAFPGTTPARLVAHRRARAVGERLLTLMCDRLEVPEEERPRQLAIPAGAEIVDGYVAFPPGEDRVPLVIATNGLEGTLDEMLPALERFRDARLAAFAMEMPGTYSYGSPMSVEVYRAVIDHLAQHPRVDPERIAIVGVSFGGYWAARLAATDPRIRCAVACGAPLGDTFAIRGGLGTPRVITDALRKVSGAGSIVTLLPTLRRLVFSERIDVPLLVINGDHDTLCATSDSVKLAERSPRSTLKLYPGDDHCAMGHYDEWLDLTREWLEEQLAP